MFIEDAQAAVASDVAAFMSGVLAVDSWDALEARAEESATAVQPIVDALLMVRAPAFAYIPNVTHSSCTVLY